MPQKNNLFYPLNKNDIKTFILGYLLLFIKLPINTIIMKVFLIASALTLIGSCADIRHSQEIGNIKNDIIFENTAIIQKHSHSITVQALSNHVHALASDNFEGREPGHEGFDKASKFVRDFYIEHEIASPIGVEDYYQRIPKSYFSETSPASQNVMAYIEGSTYPDEIIIISGHLDHLGRQNEVIYYGADDNASGTAAVLEIAKAFARAQKEGHGPKRSLLFLHLTAEEIGLFGSSYYVKHPVYALDHTIANLNIDMIGRVDKIYQKKKNQNYIYLIGADRLSTELHNISEAANSYFTNLILDYKYNDENDPNRYYYRSDHYNFAQNNIPVIFYFNGNHTDYHKPTDTPDKINYPLLQKRTQLVFATAWYLANSKKRLEFNTP